MSLFIQKIRLTNFRNIEHLQLDIETRINFFSGDNGLGKTNLLDALSRMHTHRGLKNQPSKDCVNIARPYYGWGVGIEFSNGDIIQYGRTAQHEKMLYHYNQTPINHDDLKKRIPILWLTPVGEKLFTQEHSDIRRYIDYLIGLVFPAITHYRHDYDKALKQRLKLLQEHGDPQWISILEHEIAKNGVQISALRRAFLDLFHQSYLDILPMTQQAFPRLRLTILCHSDTAKDIETYQNLLLNNRQQDMLAGRSLFGIHRNKIHVFHEDKNIDIYYCSTGEQKAVMSHILLAMNHLLKVKNKVTPIMLFDDAFAHYDQKRIAFFSNYILNDCDNQFFLTNTYFDTDITCPTHTTHFDLGTLLSECDLLL